MGGQKFLRGSCSIGGHSTGLLWAIAARVGWVSCHCLRHDPSCHDRLQASERQEVDLAGLEITRLLQQRGYCGALRGTISHRCRPSLFFFTRPLSFTPEGRVSEVLCGRNGRNLAIGTGA